MALGNLVKNYIKPHGSGNGNGGNTTIIVGSSDSNYDNNNLNVTNINAVKATITDIDARNINNDNFTGDYMTVRSGNINTLKGTSLTYDNSQLSVVDSDDITTDKLTVNKDATIENIINTNLKSERITTDYLTVNKSAHFFELIIDKIRSVQGTQINTAANCVIDYVEMWKNGQVVTSPPVDIYCVYWRKKDDDGRETSNYWLQKDQAICQTFNARSGNNIANKYYWRYVDAVGSNEYVNLNKDYVWDENSRFEKVRSSFTSWNLRLLNGFQYGTAGAQDNLTTFNIEAIGGSYNPSTKIWTPTKPEDTLKVYNYEYGLKNGTFIFDTGNDYAKLNVSVVYEDGSIDYNNAVNYAKTYNITTDADKNVSYFLINCQVIENWEACHWIDLSADDCDGTDIPEIGDNICQLGYRWDTLANPTADDKARASAIIIAAYATPDTGITPPSYAQYQNIGTLVNSSSRFNLADNRKTFFDANGGTIIGNFKVDTGNGDIDLYDYIKSLQDTNPFKVRVRNAQDVEVELLSLQTDSNNKIYNLNGFPSELVFLVQNDNNPVNPANLDSFYLNLFGNDPTYGRTIDLMNWTQGTTTDNYEGIYVTNVIVGGSSLQLTFIQFGWRNTSEQGGGQTVTTSSFSVYGTYTDNSNTYNFSNNVPIITVQSIEGTDAELYLLNKLNETAKVDGNKYLTVDLKYGIRHIIGTTVTDVTSTAMTLLISILKSNGTTSTESISFDSTNHYFSYTDTSITNYYTTEPVPVSYKIELKDGNNVIDSTVVNVNLGSRSLFTVEDELIQSLVTETTRIDGEIQSTNSAITQSANNIQAWVRNSLNTTGIDITAGTILLQGDKVIFADSNGGHRGNVSIDSNTGTLTAVNANLSGIFKSENTSTLYKTVIDTNNGAITLWSPKEVTSGGTPVSGTTQEKTADIGWYISPFGARSTTIGQIRLYDANESEKMNTISAHGIWLKNQYNGINTNTDGITYEDFSDSNNNLYLSWTDLIGQRLSILRTSTIDPTDLPVANTLNLYLEQSLIIINHTWNANSNFNINLPDAHSCAGKVYFIKNRRNKDLNINTIGGYIIKEDNNDRFDLPLNVDRQSCIFVSDGTDWITFTDIS